MPPTYRDRLRIEGLTLAACGVAGSAGLLAFKTEQATRWPLNTIGQLAVVAGLLGWLGPRAVRRSIDGAQELTAGGEGSGEPTPLWQLPVIVAGLAGTFVALQEVNDRAGWDAALRITGGCTLVGLAQAVVLERLVAADEDRRGRTYFRFKGSRLGRGTKLGFVPRG
jgi:uncharacterized protein YjeT (DUF2065 family)